MMHRMLRQFGTGSGSGVIARAVLVLCLATIFFGKLQAAAPAQDYGTTSGQIAPQFVFADFDGDSRPDSATVQAGATDGTTNHYLIRFQLSTGFSSHINLTAPTGGLDISSRDINGDSFLDVIVTTAWSKRPVAVLLNDGHGNFTSSDPYAFPGAFPNSDRSWGQSLDGIRDASPASLARIGSTDFESSLIEFLPPPAAQLCSPRLQQFAAQHVSVFFFGRAPPSQHNLSS